jgi:molecular chaperone GrpE
MYNETMEPKKSAKSVKDDVPALKEQLQQFKELAARAQADLQNAKVRMEKQAGELGSIVVAEFLHSLLPTLDHFQRAFQHLPADLRNHEWVKGVTAIEQGLLRQVESFGLKRMASLGEGINPDRHEILLEVSGDPGKVVEVIEEGYEFRGRVLRPAKVKVGRTEVQDSKETKESKEKTETTTTPVSPGAP